MVVAAYLTGVAVARVFVGGETLAMVAPMLMAIAALGVSRGPLLVGVDHFAGRAAGTAQGHVAG